MTARALRETANQSILPVLLGNTRQAHRLSSRLFRRCGVISVICGRPRLWDIADFTSVTLRMPKTNCERLTVEALIGFAEEYREPLLLLVPCSETAASTVARHEKALEHYFMRSDTEAILSSSPLSAFEAYDRARGFGK